jgi:hypothetical protein
MLWLLGDGNVAHYPSSMWSAISGLVGALVGGAAVIIGGWLQSRNAAELQRELSNQQEKRRLADRAALLDERRQILTRRYLYQLVS